MAGILNEYMLDYVTWLGNEQDSQLPFGLAFQRYQKRRDALSDIKYENESGYGYSIDNPIMGLSTPHLRDYIKSLKKEDGQNWEILYENTEKDVCIHGYDHLSVHVYKVVYNEETYCKLYFCPFGRATERAPKGFILSEEGYKHPKCLTELEAEYFGYSYESYLKIKGSSVEKTENYKQREEEDCIDFYMCDRCGSDLLKTDQFCFRCGKRNRFYAHNATLSLPDRITITDLQKYRRIEKKCHICGKTTVSKFYSNSQQKSCEAVYCTHCGQKCDGNVEAESKGLFEINQNIFAYGEGGIVRIGFDLQVFKNGEIEIDHVLLDEKINDDQLKSIRDIIRTYMPILECLQQYNEKRNSAEGEYYGLKFDGVTLITDSIMKWDMYSVQPNQRETALYGNIVLELVKEIAGVFNKNSIGIRIETKDMNPAAFGNVSLSYPTEIEVLLKSEKRRHSETKTQNVNKGKTQEKAQSLEVNQFVEQRTINNENTRDGTNRRLRSCARVMCYLALAVFLVASIKMLPYVGIVKTISYSALAIVAIGVVLLIRNKCFQMIRSKGTYVSILIVSITIILLCIGLRMVYELNVNDYKKQIPIEGKIYVTISYDTDYSGTQFKLLTNPHTHVEIDGITRKNGDVFQIELNHDYDVLVETGGFVDGTHDQGTARKTITCKASGFTKGIYVDVLIASGFKSTTLSKGTVKLRFTRYCTFWEVVLDAIGIS